MKIATLTTNASSKCFTSSNSYNSDNNPTMGLIFFSLLHRLGNCQRRKLKDERCSCLRVSHLGFPLPGTLSALTTPSPPLGHALLFLLFKIAVPPPSTLYFCSFSIIITITMYFTYEFYSLLSTLP